MPTGSLDLEGIVSKTPGVAVQVRPLAPDWLKFKSPEAPAVKREARKMELGAVTRTARQRVRETRVIWGR